MDTGIALQIKPEGAMKPHLGLPGAMGTPTAAFSRMSSLTAYSHTVLLLALSPVVPGRVTPILHSFRKGGS